MLNVLLVTSEAYPLAKTGGLGDVCGSLPRALATADVDVRVLMPAYRDTLARTGKLKAIATMRLPPGDTEARLLEGRLPGSRVRVWLLDHPGSYDRSGNPYLAANGQPWPDNAERFALLNYAAAALALGNTPIDWRPDVVHGHDWQSGLIPALLSREVQRPATLFTVHNLAYQGLFPYETFVALGLPPSLWSFQALEFHGQLSFIKGGIAFADHVTTVSPTYAREIQTPEYGDGLDGLLRYRHAHLSGILNGIDERTWNPGRDAEIAHPYSARRLAGKPENKQALQQEMGLPLETNAPLCAFVGRLVSQKGVDLILAALPAMADLGMQLVVLGTGEAHYEAQLRTAALHHPKRLAVHIGYDEALAHRMIAGADLFLMPSRFEPCGLSQLYALRYGTVPVVRRVGGLADTVTDASTDRLADGSATGFVFEEASADALLRAVDRALACYRDDKLWHALMRAGMRQDHSWRHRAAEYVALYHALVEARQPRTS